MIARDEMRDFIGQVVSETMPDEALAFEVEGGNLIADLYQGRPVAPRPAAGAEHEFMDATGAEAVLEFVKLLTATFELLKVASGFFSTKARDDPPEGLAKEWRTQLVRAGLPEKKADEIARRFTSDLIKRIRKL